MLVIQMDSVEYCQFVDLCYDQKAFRTTLYTVHNILRDHMENFLGEFVKGRVICIGPSFLTIPIL